MRETNNNNDYLSSAERCVGGTNGKKLRVPTIGGNPLYARISFTSANKSFFALTHLVAPYAPPTVQSTCIHGSIEINNSNEIY
ncbi:MAG: hypothetical protein ACI8RD_003021 [Bacillariaceae sp.]|jgi:hypothetical protein